jgi:hypothetical protein
MRKKEGIKSVRIGRRGPPYIGEEGASPKGGALTRMEVSPPLHGGNPLINMR